MTQSDSLYFDAALAPHRSLKPEHFKRLLLGLIAVFTIAGIRFSLAGAWPVAAFLWLDLAALWLAFYINYRRGRVREYIRLDDTTLQVKRVQADGRSESWVFEPYWAKLVFTETDDDENELVLSLHGQQVVLGVFLSPRERKSLHNALKTALYEWKIES